MLNNFHFVALHVLMCTMPSFAILVKGCLVKFDAILPLFIGSRLNLQRPTFDTARFNHLKVVDS